MMLSCLLSDHWGDNKTIQKAIKQKEEPKKLKEIPN
jgi:hypothetical protein